MNGDTTHDHKSNGRIGEEVEVKTQYTAGRNLNILNVIMIKCLATLDTSWSLFSYKTGFLNVYPLKNSLNSVAAKKKKRNREAP